MTISWTKITKQNSDGNDYYYVNTLQITSDTPPTDCEEEYGFPTTYTDQQITDYIITDLTNKGYG